jgi:hypothetical protein
MLVRICTLLVLLSSLTVAAADEGPHVSMLRLPEGAIQPQAAVGDDGAVHVIYFRGPPQQGDVFYAQLEADGESLGEALQVNQQPGSAIAIGNIRGAHLALGRNDRVHVAWMGAKSAKSQGPGGASPMLYTRINAASTAFETERNVIDRHVGLDGGGSLAADRQGNVYVVWHAPDIGKKGEIHRRVWVTRSRDDGRTFEPERAAFDQPTGCCGCCGMRAMADQQGRLFILYRSAEEATHRDMWLLASNDRSQTFRGTLADRWTIDTCVMSTAALADTAEGVLAAWETEGQVYFGEVDARDGRVARPIAAPGAGGGRKYPVVATDGEGRTIFAWTEGMGWDRGGAVAWQVYDSSGAPIAGVAGRAEHVPVWGLVAVFARPDGRFVVLY